MYNYFNLDSAEFEELSAEVLTIYLNSEFRTYAEGKDQGIDFRSPTGDISIIGQAKRYKSVSGVFDDELEKIKKLDCKKFYLFIACELSQKKHADIYNNFSDYMDDENNIFDGKRLDELLDKPEYSKVLKKHFKLWASSTRVLELLTTNKLSIDTDVLISRIKKHSPYYVETDDFKNISNTFFKERMILIKGNPGVGKTTISEMLVLKMLNEHPETHFLYNSTGNAEEIKNSLSGNPNDRELIYVDDFLGDIYLDLRKNDVNGICSLISYVANCPNKYLILNTRVVILNNATNKFVDFKTSLEEIGIKEITIENISRFDKAKILYNHIYFSSIPYDKKKEFLDKKYYLDIINHKNYNPRSIETLSSNRNFEMSGMANYLEYCNSVLEKQEDTWLNAYQNNLSEADRALLLVLYSFIYKFDYVAESILEEAYNLEISNGYEVSRTLNNFRNSLLTLNETFISVVLSNGTRLVSFYNPSVKECVKKCFVPLKNKPLYFDQMALMDKKIFKSETIKKVFENHQVDNMRFLFTSKSVFCGLFFAHNKETDFGLEYEKEFIEALSYNYSINYSTDFSFTYPQIFKILVSMKLFDLVELNKISDSDITYFVISCLTNFDLQVCKEIFSRFDKDRFALAIQDNERIKDFFLDSEINHLDVNEIMSNNMDYYGGGEVDYDGEAAKEEALEKIKDLISDNDVYNYLKDDFNFAITSLDIDDSLENSDVSSILRRYSDDEHDEYEYYDDMVYSDDDDSKINILFSNLLDEND